MSTVNANKAALTNPFSIYYSVIYFSTNWIHNLDKLYQNYFAVGSIEHTFSIRSHWRINKLPVSLKSRSRSWVNKTCNRSVKWQNVVPLSKAAEHDDSNELIEPLLASFHTRPLNTRTRFRFRIFIFCLRMYNKQELDSWMISLSAPSSSSSSLRCYFFFCISEKFGNIPHSSQAKNTRLDSNAFMFGMDNSFVKLVIDNLYISSGTEGVWKRQLLTIYLLYI